MKSPFKNGKIVTGNSFRRNVSKNKKILQEKDIVEIHGKAIIFNDPVFEYWLRQS